MRKTVCALDGDLAFSDHVCVASIPASIAAAEWNALKPNIGFVMRLMKRWSCSTLLFKYLLCIILISRPSFGKFTEYIDRLKFGQIAPTDP